MSPSPDRRFRAALVQLCSGRSVEPNLDQAEALIRRAARGGAHYVQTPENTALMELGTERVLQAAQSEQESLALRRLRALAAELGIYLHIGSLAIELDGSRVANRSYLIDPGGEIAARYDKLHMFDVDLPNGETARESETYEPGADTGSDMLRHVGEEGGVVVSGKVEVTIGGQTRVLGPGDAYYFASAVPHRFRNRGR